MLLSFPSADRLTGEAEQTSTGPRDPDVKLHQKKSQQSDVPFWCNTGPTHDSFIIELHRREKKKS